MQYGIVCNTQVSSEEVNENAGRRHSSCQAIRFAGRVTTEVDGVTDAYSSGQSWSCDLSR